MPYAPRLTLVLAAAVFTATLGLGPAAAPEDIAERLALTGERAAGQDLGLAVALVADGEALYAGAWNRDARGQPASVERAFAAPGLTALLIALRAGAAVASDELDVDEPLASFFPDEAAALLADTPYAEISLEHLLAHTSGFVERLDDTPMGPEELFTWLASQALESEPGRCFQPREDNRRIAERALALHAGSTLENWFNDAAIEPLELAATAALADRLEDDPDDPSGGRAREAASGVDPPLDLPLFETSAGDLARLFDALASERVLAGALERASREVWLTDGQRSPVSWELERGSLGDHEVLIGQGRGQGTSFVVAHYPELELTIAVVASSEDLATTQRIERSLARTAFELPEPGSSDESLAPEQLELFRGGYYIGCTRISIEPRQDQHLYATWPEGRELRLCYRGYDSFQDCDDPEVVLVFQRDDPEQRPLAFELDDHGWQAIAMRID